MGLLHVYSRLKQISQYTEDNNIQVSIIPERSDRKNRRMCLGSIGNINTSTGFLLEFKECVCVCIYVYTTNHISIFAYVLVQLAELYRQ